MAITSYGFGVDSLNTEGEIGVVQWAQMASYLGAQYSVVPAGAPGALEGLGAYLPNSGDRRVDIRSGACVAYGTYTISSSTIPITLPASPSGSRWHILGVKRDWTLTSDHATFVDLGYGATIAAALATLVHNPGVRDDQPLWAAQTTAGNSGITSLVDLRVWGSGSQLIAHSAEVLNYMSRRGTEIRIGNVSYTRTVDVNYNEYWSDSRAGTILSSIPGEWAALAVPGAGAGSSWRVWGNSPQTIATISIPDPGIPFRIQAQCQAFMGSESNATTRWDFDFLVDGAVLTSFVSTDDLTMVGWRDLISLPSAQIYTGSKTLSVRARRIYGTDYGAIQTSGRGIRAVTYGA